MEFDFFEEIRKDKTQQPDVTAGRMMRSPAIHYKGKVFAFFSRKNNMVFKLGKEYPQENLDVPLQEFNPFKNKKPLSGWYEVASEHKASWKEMAELALYLAIKSD